MKFINDRRELRSQSGFTLIELLDVIAILGILAGVVVFAVGGINNNSQQSACKIEARTVKTAVQAYEAQESDYPADEATLVTGNLLEDAPELVGYTLVAGVPTYAWEGDCVGVTGLPATP